MYKPTNTHSLTTVLLRHSYTKQLLLPATLTHVHTACRRDAHVANPQGRLPQARDSLSSLLQRFGAMMGFDAAELVALVGAGHTIAKFVSWLGGWAVGLVGWLVGYVSGCLAGCSGVGWSGVGCSGVGWSGGWGGWDIPYHGHADAQASLQVPYFMH